MQKSKFSSAKTFRIKTKYLAYLSVFVALALIFNIIDIPLGIGDIKISLTYIPVMLSGIYLGPIAGAIVGMLGDLLGMLIKPQGPWIPLITLGSIMMGLLPGLVFKIPKVNAYIKIAISLVLVFGICTCTLNSLGIYLAYFKTKKAFAVFMAGRMGMQSIIFVINSVLIFSLYYPLQKFIFDKAFPKKKQVEAVDVVSVVDNKNE